MRKLTVLVLLLTSLCGIVLGESRPAYITQYTHGDREHKRIAVTVDDWYEPELLGEFLDVAAQYGCRLTLYPIGINLHEKDRAAWQRALDEGHELGNHSNTHKSLENASRSSILAQLDNMEKRLEKTLGYPHVMNTMRYPFGDGRYNGVRGTFAKTILEGGYAHVALWDVDSTNPKEILRKTQNGSIILLHGRKKDLRTLKVILAELQLQGYEMVTISQLLGIPAATQAAGTP